MLKAVKLKYNKNTMVFMRDVKANHEIYMTPDKKVKVYVDGFYGHRNLLPQQCRLVLDGYLLRRNGSKFWFSMGLTKATFTDSLLNQYGFLVQAFLCQNLQEELNEAKEIGFKILDTSAKWKHVYEYDRQYEQPILFQPDN